MKILYILSTLVVFTLLLSGCSNIDITNENGQLKTFKSENELNEFIESSSQINYYSRNSLDMKSTSSVDIAVQESADSSNSYGSSDGSLTPSVTGSESIDFSGTNNQVENVDEADIVKTDGEFIYYLSNDKIYILNAKDMEILSKIEYDESYPQEIYIKDNKLVVLGSENYKTKEEIESIDISSKYGIMPRYYRNYAFVKIYNIDDKKNPELEEKIFFEGNYRDSRMIGNYTYVILNKGIYGKFIPPIIYYGDGLTRTIEATDVSYFDMPDNSYELSLILSVNLNDNSFLEKSILKGYNQEIYVSEDNIYLINHKYVPYYLEEKRILEEVVMNYLPSDIKEKINKINSYELRDQTKLQEIEYVLQDYSQTLSEEEMLELEEKTSKASEKIRLEIEKEREKTIINRIELKNGLIEHKAKGEVPGNVLNQFSMDEFENYFRIATTTGNTWSENNVAKNNVYVLDMDLKIVGQLEDLAPKETIYSARFMGKRAYLVTFRNVDPLFVIDLENPENPNVLGKLKIPGFSNYLHPYDENHIIGIGKSTQEDSTNKEVVRIAGLKMSLFDVTDVENPKEISKVEIGDRGTDSDALYNHKAFLFSKSKNLLVIPIRVAEIDLDKYNEDQLRWAYGDFVFQGAYVYNITIENGFDLKGKITHISDDSLDKSGYYYYSDESILRSLYIENVLYTFSNTKIMANNLDNLKELSNVELDKPKREEEYIYYEKEIEPIAIN